MLCIALLLSMLPVLGACSNGGSNDQQTQGNSSSAFTVPSEWLLSDFTIVRSDEASDEVVDAVIRLKNTVKEYADTTLPLATDLLAKDETPFEILVGASNRQIYTQQISALKGDEYVIKTVATENGGKIVVGGKTDRALLGAITSLDWLFQENGVVTDGGRLSELNISGSGMSYLGEENVKKLVIVCAPDLGTRTKNAVKVLRNEIELACGKKPEEIIATADTKLSDYPYAIVVGAVGETAVAMKNGLKGSTAFHAKADSDTNSFKAYLVGGNDYATVRALQYFYKQSVIDRTLNIPLFMDAEITPLKVRDPYIVEKDGKYYLYENMGTGVGVRSSTDLYNWSPRKSVYSNNAYNSFWAPECHYYNGNYYIFTTFADGSGYRGMGILKCATPDGQFTLISKQSANATEVGHITPNNRNYIDGTLHVEADGTPYMIYSVEWDKAKWQAGDREWIGRMEYVQLSADLTHFVGQPVVMFEADAPAWTNYGICEAPFTYRCADGTLLMLWSNNGDTNGYSVGVAKSSNGRIDGEWTEVSTKALFCYDHSSIYSVTDGGHGMLIKDGDGRLILAIHTVNNDADNVALTLIPIVESGGRLRIDTIKKS